MTSSSCIFFSFRRRAASCGRIILCVLLLALLSGCASLIGGGPPPTRMQLHPRMPAKAASTANTQLVVSLPQAGSDLDTDAMALLFHGREVRYLSGYRWNMNLPLLLQNMFIEAIQTSGSVRGVADDTSGISASARLLCDIRQFSLQYEEENRPPTAVVQLVFRLVNLHTGTLIDTKAVDSHVPAAGTDTENLVRAYEEALAETLAEMSLWVGKNMRTRTR